MEYFEFVKLLRVFVTICFRDGGRFAPQSAYLCLFTCGLRPVISCCGLRHRFYRITSFTVSPQPTDGEFRFLTQPVYIPSSVCGCEVASTAAPAHATPHTGTRTRHACLTTRGIKQAAAHERRRYKGLNVKHRKSFLSLSGSVHLTTTCLCRRYNNTGYFVYYLECLVFRTAKDRL